MNPLRQVLSWLRSERNLSPNLTRPSYVDRHQGCTALIVATGPSLGAYGDRIEVLRKRYDAVTLGANNVTKYLHPTYHCFTNRKRFRTFAKTIEPTVSKVLLSPYFPKSFIKQSYPGDYESLMYVSDHNRRFDIEDGIIQASCRTVGVLLIGVAIVMGAERIFVAGMDGYKNLLEGGYPIHHYEEEPIRYEQEEQEERRLLESERFNSRFMAEIANYLESKGKEPFYIVTPTVHQEYYRPIEGFL